MLRNQFHLYGNDDVRIPAHLSFGKEVYDNMVKNKEVTALINAETGDQMSYGEVAQMTADVALSLIRMGIGKGEVVCICSEKILEYLPTVMGIICAGATFSPMDPTSGSFTLLHQLNIAQPTVMFCSLTAFETHKVTFDKVESIQHYILYGNQTKAGAGPGGVLFKDFLKETAKIEDFQPVPVKGWEDVVFIFYSSGTTGLPKGVPFTHLGFLSDCQQMVTMESKGVGVYSFGEFYSIYSFTYALACLRGNATIVYDPRGGEKNMLEATQKYKLRVLQLTPTAAIMLATSAILDNYDASSVENIVAAGVYIPDYAVKDIKQRFPNALNIVRQYGMTEAGLICHQQFATKGSRVGSSGMVANGVVVKVVDVETRKPVGPNERGEICMKGYALIQAYSNNVVPDFKDDEGFLKTGDIGYYDNDGYLFIFNRIKDLIKFNGITVAPAEFEALLLQHPSVSDAGVVGKPHPMHGQVPVAFIVLQPGCTATEEELVQHVNSRVTFRMRLAGGVRFIDCLPRGLVSHKLNRNDLLKILHEEDINGN